MTRTSRWLQGAAAALTTLIATSCYYDPGYAGGGYDSGYYGGGGGLNTTFVYTSNDRWLYDPAVYCYYDRQRRCYYDPYLYGYYPVGYCPPPIYGGRHPNGWRPGGGYCPPPSNYQNRYLSNYKNRVSNLKAKNYAWAQKVREQNQATTQAWRNQRANAAAKFQNARDAQSARNHNMRANQAQKQQNIRDQQKNWADKVRSQPQRQAPQRQAPPQNQRSQRSSYNQPVNTAGSGRQRAQQPPARQSQPAPRNNGGGKSWKEKVQGLNKKNN